MAGPLGSNTNKVSGPKSRKIVKLVREGKTTSQIMSELKKDAPTNVGKALKKIDVQEIVDSVKKGPSTTHAGDQKRKYESTYKRGGGKRKPVKAPSPGKAVTTKKINKTKFTSTGNKK